MPAAQVLLSMIAPAAPPAPQGSAAAGDVAADFQGLLAGLLGAVAADGASPSPPIEQTDASDGETNEAAAAGFLAAPPPALSVPLVRPPEDAADPQTQPPAAEAPDPTLPPAPEVRLVEAGPDGRQVLPAADASKAPTPDVRPPEVRPQEPVKDGAPKGGPAPDVQAEAAEPKLVPVPADLARDAAPSRPAAAAPFAPPPPAPLRPLADSAARPLDSASRDAARSAQAPETAPAGAPQGPAPSADPSVPVSDKAAPPAPPAAPLAADAADSEAPDAAVEGPVSSDPTAPAAHPATRETAVPVISRATVDAVAQIAARILQRLDGRSTRFEMSLTPDELGRVDVRLDIDSEGRLAARLAFDNPAAAADLKGRADDLRRQLEQQGFHLADDAFEFADRDSGSSAFDRGQDARQAPARFSAASRLAAETDAALLGARASAWSLSPSGVDLKV